jgi:hypothetical protein
MLPQVDHGLQRPEHSTRSVRRASGYVLTSNPEVIHLAGNALLAESAYGVVAKVRNNLQVWLTTFPKVKIYARLHHFISGAK